MKKGLKKTTLAVTSFLLTCLTTYLWYNVSIFQGLSERLWTVYSKIDDGQNPGLASDLEFITVFGCSLVIFVLVINYIFGKYRFSGTAK